MVPPLSGLVAAPFTPLRPTGEVAFETIPLLANLLIKNRVNAAFVCGTTGEGSSLSTDERRAVSEAWVSAASSKLKVTVHVGHLSITESRGLAAHAQKIGADAIATIAPSFFKPNGPKELVAWCREVAAAAPGLPFYYYHMPAMTGVTITAEDFLKEAEGKIPNFVGIKFTHEDLEDFKASREFGGNRYSILFGRDEILLSGLELGSPGAVGSTYNYMAPLFHRIMAAFAAGDLETAKAEQSRAQEIIRVMERHGGLPAGKAIMKLIGIDCGPTRLPLRALSVEDQSQLRRDLESVQFFASASQR